MAKYDASFIYTSIFTRAMHGISNFVIFTGYRILKLKITVYLLN